MNDRIKDMFEQVTMPEKTESRIRAAMREKDRRIRKSVWRIAVSYAAVVVMMIMLSPQARAAFDQWRVKYFWSDSDLTIYEELNEEGEVAATIAEVDTDAPAFARMINGRLFFLGNGEKIDITDVIAEDSPFYYSYEDEYGLTHDMAVGYSGTLDNYGIYEFIWKEENGQKIWTAGTGRNFLSREKEIRYPWVEIVWQDLNIPWPMPE